MAEYFDPRHSTYHPRHEEDYSNTLSYVGDPVDENDLRRTVTHESHQSHASASTRSWVYSQMNQPQQQPMDSVPTHTPTTFHGPRPLPDPHHHQQQQHYNLQQQEHPIFRRPPPVEYADTQEEEEANDYMPPDNGIPGAFEYQNVDFGSTVLAGPDMAPGGRNRGNRSFVGGFFSGLKRIPKLLRGGDRGKKKLTRQGTFGTEGTGSVNDFNAGNTLPRYLSNPSIRPSNPQFAHRLSMAVANGALPPDSTPAVFQLRQHLAGPQFPAVTVTPPSDGIAEEEQADFYDGEPAMDEDPRYSMHPGSHPTSMAAMNDNTRYSMHPSSHPTPMVAMNDNTRFSTHHSSHPVAMPGMNDNARFSTHPGSHPPPMNQTPMDRTPMDRTPTVMVYNTDSQAPTITQVPPSSIPAHPVLPSSGPRVSYQTELPTRASAQAQTDPIPPLPIPLAASIGSPISRRRTTPRSPLGRSTRDVLSASAEPTSRYTGTTATSYYDPSFASDLSPVEKFFKGLYNLPWVAQRVTVDYRPGDTPRAKGKMKSLKKPKSSWYHSILSRHSRDLDLLSGSNTVTSAPTSNILSSLGSPISRRSGRSSNRHHSSKPKHRRRRTATSASSDTHIRGHHRTGSPIIPTVYPYTVPPYPPYTYPYMPYPAIPMPQVPGQRTTAPRGPRAARSHHRGPKYPHGYTPYQPMAMPSQPPPMPMPPPGAPMYYITPSPPQSHNGQDAGVSRGHAPAGSQGPVQFSPVLVHYVPGAYPQAEASSNAMVSPPTTPRRKSPRS